MPKKITAWQCEYCNRYRKTKSSIVRHEKICFQNPDRTIPDGQLAIFSTLPRDLIVWDSYGVPNSSFQEPMWFPGKELSNKYKWWPRDEDGAIGLGYVRVSGDWVKISGYKPPNFAPGYSWKDETFDIEVTPGVIHGKVIIPEALPASKN